MIKKFQILFLVSLFSLAAFSQQKTLLIRCDDMGMSHSVNMAIEEVLKTGLPVSVSVMVPCPWFNEAVEILKKYQNAAPGVHLTLNSEWKNYKWGPVSGRSAVPSLVDKDGYFFPSRASLFANNPTLQDVEKELRAQLEKALNSGLSLAYLDYHMGTAMDRPEYRDIVESLAKEHNLAISRYYKEYYTNNMYDDPLDTKADTLYSTLTSTLKDDTINLLVCHLGMDDPELGAMEDMNSFGLKDMSKNRNAELNGLLTERNMAVIKSDKIKLINYADLKEKEKTRPAEFEY